MRSGSIVSLTTKLIEMVWVIKRISVFIAILPIIVLTGCASIVNGVDQKVSVTTPPAKDSNCLLKNSKGVWHVRHTPGSVVVHRAYGKLTVTCDKNGYIEAVKIVKSHTKAMAFGNIIFGGLIGAGVDVGTGAAYNYPDKITVPMRRAKIYAPKLKSVEKNNSGKIMRRGGAK